MRKFPAEITSYQIVHTAAGVVARVKLEIPEQQIPESYFLGGIVHSYADFTVDNIKKEDGSQNNQTE